MNITIFIFSGLIFTTNQYFGNIQGTNGIICRLSQDRYNQVPTGDIYNLSSIENKPMLCNPTIPSTQMPTAGYHFTTATAWWCCIGSSKYSKPIFWISVCYL